VSYYKHHVFFCTNQRTDGRASCQDHNAQEMRDYLKKKVKEAGLSGPGGIRINKAGVFRSLWARPSVGYLP